MCSGMHRERHNRYLHECLGGDTIEIGEVECIGRVYYKYTHLVINAHTLLAPEGLSDFFFMLEVAHKRIVPTRPYERDEVKTNHHCINNTNCPSGRCTYTHTTVHTHHSVSLFSLIDHVERDLSGQDLTGPPPLGCFFVFGT